MTYSKHGFGPTSLTGDGITPNRQMTKQTLHSVYLDMLCAYYSDIVSAYPAQYQVEQKRDVACIKQRYASEGASFLTKTLPSLAKAIDTALASGTPLQFSSFSRKKGTNLPNFLGWLIGRVFSLDGTESVNSDPVALRHIRTLLYLFYKLELPYSPEDVDLVINAFKATDAGLLSKEFDVVDHSAKCILKQASDLICQVLDGVSPRDIIPGHGPGSVATGEKGPQKPYFRRIYPDLIESYPLDEYFYANSGHMCDRLAPEGLMVVEYKTDKLLPWRTMEHPTAKVVLVPKDSRGPRLISMEPLEIQWIQQGQCVALVDAIESHWITRGHVNFTSQGINRYLAWYSSLPPNSDGSISMTDSQVSTRDLLLDEASACVSCQLLVDANLPRDLSQVGQIVTLDMKEASDRVSESLVIWLFSQDWVKALMATRSTHTELPDGEVIALNKFAPMGSAVCFPVEALVFYALAVASVVTALPNVRTSTAFNYARRRVWVYGDDIICYREDYPVIKSGLERFGLLLNSRKCCLEGFFRESCGLDSYKGIIVTPLRISKLLISTTLTAQLVMAFVAYSNAAYRLGYTELAKVIENYLLPRIAIPFTTVERGLVQFCRPLENVRSLNRLHRVKTRFNRYLHYMEAYGPTPIAVTTHVHRCTYEVLFQGLLKMLRQTRVVSPRTTITSSTLEAGQYSVPRRVSSKRGWTQITL